MEGSIIKQRKIMSTQNWSFCGFYTTFWSFCVFSHTINPLFSYNDVTFLRIFDNVFVCRFFKTSTVMNFMYREIVIMKGILFTNIMSIHRVTLRYLSRISRSTGSLLSNTCFGGVLTVLPFNDPRFVPKILSAAIISDFDIGDFK